MRKEFKKQLIIILHLMITSGILLTIASVYLIFQHKYFMGGLSIIFSSYFTVCWTRILRDLKKDD